METKKIATAIVSGVIATSLSMASMSAHAVHKPTGTQERCYGIAKAGQNDCGGPGTGHSCQGQSTKNNDPYDYKIMPKGSCTKLGGSLTPGQKA